MSRRIDSHEFYEVDKSGKEISFLFDGSVVWAREGDTISSALVASGRKIVSRSFKYHRPRGIYDADGYGPESLVTVDDEPNLLADRVLARNGMDVRSQNNWPSLDFDLAEINDVFVPFLPNGFYYKMFHKPKWLWPIAEKQIRKVAGLGSIDTAGRHNSRRYEKRYRFPDICIVGGGPSGLAAAKAALGEGKQVLLLDDHPELGGHSLHSLARIQESPFSELEGLSEHEGIRKLAAELQGNPNLEIMSGAMVFGVYEDNLVAAQWGNDLMKIRADKVILATGASDRHLVFDNNDRPGIMTARGVERLIMVHGIAPAEEAVVVTTHDGGYHTALLLHGAGVKLKAVVDSRASGTEGVFEKQLEALNIPIYREMTAHRAHGRKKLQRVDVGPVKGGESFQSFDCDLLVTAVGLMPRLNLLSMGRGRPEWDAERQVLRIMNLPEDMYSVGEVEGPADISSLLQQGMETGLAAAKGNEQPKFNRKPEENIEALPADIESGGDHHFICKCMDVTRKEACMSIDEGFDQVESLKRYTSLGMGPCQGKSCHEAVARLAALDTGLTASDAVPTTMRPPAFPVSFGLLSGRAHHLGPIRRTPMHHCHIDLGVKFLDAGAWKRPDSYMDPQQEALYVRKGVAMIDVSTLGKIELSGPDVIEFMHFMLPGKFAKLDVGRTRYAIMIGEDGILFEDGTISQIEKGKYYISTTTGNQDAIYTLFQWWLTTGDYDVQVKNLSAGISGVNITGPKVREFLSSIIDLDFSNEAFPYMHNRQATLEGVPLNLFRIGFTGELGYEIHFPSEFGESLWNYFMEKGEPFGLKPFGVETQRILRLEKGHLIPGADTDALSNPYEAGVGFAIKDDKEDFIGKAFLAEFKQREIENRLVPYRLQEGDAIPIDGVAVIADGKPVGRVTSSRMSPTLGYGIGMAWVPAGSSEAGNHFNIRSLDGTNVIATVLDHAAYDPEGQILKS